MTDHRDDPVLVFAERIDALRVIPRLILAGYYVFFGIAFWDLVGWFTSYEFNSLENEAVALAIAGFPAAVLGVLTGVLSSLTKSYWDGGRRWNGKKGDG